MDFWHDAAVQKCLLRRFLLLTVALLLPVFVLAIYARPSADDYIYATDTHAVVAQYGFDLPRLLAAAWQTNVYYFKNWQGLYVSAFVQAFQPAIFGNRLYGVTLLCVLVPLFLCLWGAARLVVRQLEPAQKRAALFLAVLLCFAFIEGMPSPVEGLYWYNAAMNYVPYFALTLLNAALGFSLCLGKNISRKRRTVYILCGCLLGFFIGGGHQVVGVLNILLLLAVALPCVKRRNFAVLPALFCAAAGLLINITAPGTLVRASSLARAGLGEAIVKSFLLAASEWLRWLDVPLVCLLLLAAPCLRHLALSGNLPDRVFRRPLIGAVFTQILLWTMIFLPSYTMGGIGAGRLLNVVWMSFVCGLLVTEFLLLGCLERLHGVSFARVERKILSRRYSSLVCAAMLVCMACIGGHTVKEGQDNYFATSLEAVYELADGQAARFAAALDEREALLTDTAQPDVTIYPLASDARPWLLFYTDVSPGADKWGLTPYYGKSSVTVGESEQDAGT